MVYVLNRKPLSCEFFESFLSFKNDFVEFLRYKSGSSSRVSRAISSRVSRAISSRDFERKSSFLFLRC